MTSKKAWITWDVARKGENHAATISLAGFQDNLPGSYRFAPLIVIHNPLDGGFTAIVTVLPTVIPERSTFAALVPSHLRSGKARPRPIQGLEIWKSCKRITG